jgi:hypothetical protein
MPTVGEGVTARMFGFETTGEFVMRPLLQRHNTREIQMMCCQPKGTERMTEATGESWTLTEAVGQECTCLAANHAHRIWLKFAIAEPEYQTCS